MDPAFKPATERMLKMMPGGRCPYPPGDRPGGGPGFDADGHWIGQATCKYGLESRGEARELLPFVRYGDSCSTSWRLSKGWLCHSFAGMEQL
eukprot:6173926-Pleurochrysis_carterae.AAC.7